jgi:anti-sigma B factor antagonist
MNVSAAPSGELWVISVADDRIDAASAIAFKERMRDLLTGRTGLAVLDLSQVAFIDSSGLGAVVSALKMLAPGQSLHLSGLTSTVERVFRLTRMDTVFTVHRSLDDAALSLRDAG